MPNLPRTPAHTNTNRSAEISPANLVANPRRVPHFPNQPPRIPNQPLPFTEPTSQEFADLPPDDPISHPSSNDKQCVCDSLPMLDDHYVSTVRIAQKAFNSSVITKEEYLKQVESLTGMFSGELSGCLSDKLREHLELDSGYKTAEESVHHHIQAAEDCKKKRAKYEQKLKASLEAIVGDIPAEDGMVD
eukprot:GHVO01009742.1.p2 GENE.GHVO01009742.1~~GHVO01009742.1.p2  ORF type:complete len:189 (+),score=37.01 GHVO01009742.1:422-988(+)